MGHVTVTAWGGSCNNSVKWNFNPLTVIVVGSSSLNNINIDQTSAIHLGNASILSKSPIVVTGITRFDIVLEGHNRIAAGPAQSAGISCGYDSNITLPAIGSGSLDVIGGDYAAGIGTDTNGTC
jgi:hypothetical protein